MNLFVLKISCLYLLSNRKNNVLSLSNMIYGVTFAAAENHIFFKNEGPSFVKLFKNNTTAGVGVFSKIRF